MIIATEIGDKTFFIAAISAMRHNKWIVLAGALGALVLMTVLSAALGHVVPKLIPPMVTGWIAAILFMFFGLKLVREAQQHQDEEEPEEMQEAAAEIQKKSKSADVETGELSSEKHRDSSSKFFESIMHPVFVQAFTLTFLAEWGDRSQIATIALATQHNPFMVSLGGILGHSLCTGFACLTGAYFARKISMKKVHLLGAAVFLFFGVFSIFELLSGWHSDTTSNQPPKLH